MRIPVLIRRTLLMFGFFSSTCAPGAQRGGAQRSESLPENPGVEDLEQRLGPFSLAGQNTVVILHQKRIAGASDATLAETLAGVEIRDAAGNIAYQKTFLFRVEDGRFRPSVSASAELSSGKTGAGLLVHYTEDTASQLGVPQTNEFWQLFSLVNGKIAPLGKPLPIGEGMTGGPYMGVVMARAPNGAGSVISEPDTIELRAWTGSFYAYMPLRVDWNHGGLTAGQRCFEMMGGSIQERGCDMRIEANRKPPAAEFTFVRLFFEAQENEGNVQHVVLQKDSKVEILGARAITTWNENGDLIQPVFSDIWLHMRIDGQEGWIHTDQDFAAAGLLSQGPKQ